MPGPSTNGTYNWSEIKGSIENAGRRRTPVFRPEGFAWIPPINIYRDELGRIYTDFDVTIYKNVSTNNYFIDCVNGLDTNDGLTLATAFKSWKRGHDVAVAGDTLWIAEGRYDRVTGFVNAPFAKSLNIIALPGHKVRLCNYSPTSYTKTTGAMNVYQTAYPVLLDVYDDTVHDEYDDMLKYTRVGSVAECDALPGSYFYNGTTLYVRAIDNRGSFTNILGFKDQLNAELTNGIYYTEGISFEGGNVGALYVHKVVTGSPTTKYYHKNCKFKYSNNDTTSHGGLKAESCFEVFGQNSEAAQNLNDGFSYHKGVAGSPNVIEVNCVGRHNGRDLDTDNGSTQHDGGKIVRVNGEYFENAGSNVGDNHLGTQAWNIGCYAHDSKARIIGNYRSNFTAHSDAEVWLDSCRSDNSIHALLVQVDATMYVRSCDLRGSETLEDNGKRLTY